MKYVAENLASFDYKTNEEVLHVLHCIFRVLSTTGENCLAKIKIWNAGGVVEEEQGGELALYARASVAMGILFLLKNFLQELYQISES
jgi:cohesin loading factor subunit SCC2